MKNAIWMAWLALGVVGKGKAVAQVPTANLVTYAGNAGQEKFTDVLRLSDGTVLVAGAAQNLNWVPAGVPRTVLTGSGGLHNAGSPAARIGFIAQLSADLGTLRRVVSLPPGAAESISRLELSSVPGAASGDLFISGTTLDSRAAEGGYFLARLNGNFVAAPPTALSWAVNVWAEGYVFDKQPWDVGSNNRLVYVSGQSHAADWCAAYALDAGTGQRVVVPDWRTHWLTTGSEFRGLAAAAPGGAAALSYSGIVFKKSGRCDLRSWSSADYTAQLPDGNGRTKQGRWPLDAFFGGPCDPAAPTATGSGYTGYRTGSSATYGVAAVAIDRRSNNCYIGFNIKSVLPDGLPDFEPAVLALAPGGGLRWWSRLYHEKSATGQPVNSSPDQYVDGLALDYSGASAAQGSLVVLARCHGNNTENLWRGNNVAATPGAAAFQNQFTGTKGNIHISWLGKLALADGTLRRSTYLAEFEDSMSGASTAAAADPNLDGWPSPNAAWPNLNTTRALDVCVDPLDGSVAVAGVGRRTITTRRAYQKMLRAGTGAGTGMGTWNSFVRLYAPDLGSLRYSSVLTGAWNPATGTGGDNTVLAAVLPEAGRVLAVGWHKESAAAPGTPAGNPVPTVRVPAWGGAQPLGQSALLARLNTAAGPLPVTLTQWAAVRTGPATAALRWQTATETANTGFTIEKSADGRAFAEVGHLAGAGHSATPRAYAFADPAAYGPAYYRLTSHDADGTRHVSSVAFVPAAAAPTPALQAWPNPAHARVQAQATDGRPLGPLRLLDALGREQRRWPAPVGPVAELSLAGLPPGLYWLEATGPAGSLRQRLLVE